MAIQQEIQKGIDEAKRLADLAKQQAASDVAAGKAQTFQAGTATPITSADVTPISTPQFQTPTTSPVFPVAGLNVMPIEPTKPETEASDISVRLQQLNQQLAGQSAVRTQKEAELGVPEILKSQRDLSTRLKTLQAEALAIPLQIQQEFAGRGATMGGVAPIETGRLRQNAIQALSVGAMLEATRGNLQTAFDLVDRAVGQEFGPIREEIAIKTANLDLILKSPSFSLAEKNRAQAQNEAQKARAAQIASQEANAKEIKNYAVEAAQQGASSDILQRIQSARSPQEALQIAGFYLGADVRREIEDKQFQRSLQEATFNLSLEKFEEDKRQFNIEYALNQQEAADKRMKELQEKNPTLASEATSEVLQNKINLIDNLLIHRGLNKAVGPSKLGRFTPFKVDVLSGDVQDFAAGITQLVNKETIDTLINLKARGGTLGALSDQERLLLQSAATKIGTWEIKKDGVGTGRYNISESAFKKELETIRDLAIKAKARALGGGGFEVQSTEEDELRALGYSDEQIRLLKELK